MPVYEYRCERCKIIVEQLRPVRSRDSKECCHDCSSQLVRVWSAPSLIIWSGDRRFPNVTQHGDGSLSFETRAAYERHLKQNHVAEVSTSTKWEPKRRKVMSDATTSTEPPGRPGPVASSSG